MLYAAMLWAMLSSGLTYACAMLLSFMFYNALLYAMLRYATVHNVCTVPSHDTFCVQQYTFINLALRANRSCCCSFRSQETGFPPPLELCTSVHHWYVFMSCGLKGLHLLIFVMLAPRSARQYRISLFFASSNLIINSHATPPTCQVCHIALHHTTSDYTTSRHITPRNVTSHHIVLRSLPTPKYIPRWALYCTTISLHCHHFTALHCTVLYCTALHCTAPHCITLYYTARHCTVCLLHHAALSTAPHGT